MALASCNSPKSAGENPFFTQWDTPFGVPPFDKIRAEHFMPAFERGMSLHDAEIDAITSNIGSEMQEISSNNKRIAKNTLLLYFRMLVTMAVSLYTSRVVLNILGVEDFGIYNVVGGIVAMFGFINGSMTSATQRYLTFELGQNNRAQLTKVFSTSLSIHGIISFLIIVLAETVGLWFLWNKMQIPADRMNAAFWVFQCSVAASVIMIMSVPYNAAIIAHERMSAFAYISIIEVSLKLLIVCFLRYFHTDKLILYAALIVIVQFLIRLCYSWYCNRHFNETKYRWSWDKGLFKEMTGFASWNMFGSLAAITFTQGLNLLLNMFFGPVVNAARGIAVQAQTHRYPIEVVLQSQYHENVHQVSGIRLRRDPQHYPRCFAKEETAQGDQSER